nr:murein biosynthesis integral membrane protein MurJ [Propionibacterium sp.]
MSAAEAGAPDSLGRSSALMASSSMVSRVLGIVRNALLGACIGGMTGASSAFQTANTLPNTIFFLLSAGVLTAVLIPQLTRALERPDGGDEAVDALLTAAFVLMGAVTLVATALAGPLIVLFGLQGSVRDLGIAFAYLCLPQIFFYGAYAVWSQVLNVHGRFGVTMWTPALANVVQILGMAIFLRMFVPQAPAEHWTPPMIWLLAGASTLGIVVQAVALLPALRAVGYRWRPNWRLRGHGFRSSGRVAGFVVTAVLLAQVGGAITQAALNTVSERERLAGSAVPGINVYFLAFQLFMVPHGIVTVSILTALLPRMTRSAQRGDLAGLRADVGRGLTLPLLAMVPLTFAAIALALPGASLLNPGLDAASQRAIALAFSLMALGLVPYGVVALQQRFATAREDGRAFLGYQLIVTAVQLGVAGLILTLPGALGVPAVSLGQTVGNALAAALFLRLAARRLGGVPLRPLGRLAGRLCVASAPPALAAWALAALLRQLLGPGLPTELAALVGGGLLFVGAFLGMAHLTGLHEPGLLLGPRAARLLPYAPRHAADPAAPLPDADPPTGRRTPRRRA